MKGTKLNMKVMMSAPANRYTGNRAIHTEDVAIMNSTIEKSARGIAANIAASVNLYLKSVLILSTSNCSSQTVKSLLIAHKVIMEHAFNRNEVAVALAQLRKQCS